MSPLFPPFVSPLFPLDQIDFSAGPLGMLDHGAFRNVIKAIGFVMDTECEPV